MTIKIINADVIDGLRTLDDESIHCVVTSPPYYALRDYKTGTWEGGDPGCNHQVIPLFSSKSTIKGPNHKATKEGIPYKEKCGKCGAIRKDRQIGLEETPEGYINKMVEVFREIRRVLRKDGTCWLNLGDSYATTSFLGNNQGSSGALGNSKAYKEALHNKATSREIPMGLKQKDMMGIPWRVAFALQADGWYLRQDIIWAKPNPMPESVTDRCTKSHEYIFLLTKSPQYYYDATAIKDPLKDLGEAVRYARKLGYKGQVDYDEYTNWYNSRGNGKDWVNKKQTGDRLTHGQANRQHGLEPKPVLIPPTGANKRDVWNITVRAFQEAHFATFPPELPRYCILAGTSAKGCCPKCSAPWERVQARTGPDGTQVIVKASVHTAKKPDGTALMGNNNEHSKTPLERTSAGGIAKKGIVQKETVGWTPTCDCKEDEVVPCTVFDPFGGSGTTALVANKLGRNAIFTELNPDYCKMAKDRIHANDPLFVEIELEKPADLSEFLGA